MGCLDRLIRYSKVRAMVNRPNRPQGSLCQSRDAASQLPSEAA
jgi:hypothetical protein